MRAWGKELRASVKSQGSVCSDRGLRWEASGRRHTMSDS